MIAEGSTTAVRHKYNHVVCLHKITNEAIIKSGNGVCLGSMSTAEQRFGISKKLSGPAPLSTMRYFRNQPFV